MSRNCDWWPDDIEEHCNQVAIYTMWATDCRHEILGYLCWNHKQECERQKIDCVLRLIGEKNL